MILYMIRHGETDWNKAGKVQGHSDIPLNEYGRELARRTGEGMRKLSIDLAYTSPLIRARETAEIVLAGREIPLIEEPLIQEIGFGDYEGFRYKGEAPDPGSEAFNRFFRDPASYVPTRNGETIEALEERVDAFLHTLYENSELRDKSVLLSTHGAAVTAMKNCIKGKRKTGEFWASGVPKNCAVTIVRVEDGKPQIVEEDKIYYEV